MDKETKEMFGLILGKLDTMDKKIDNIEIRMGGLETRMGRLETRMDGLDTRMNGLESEFREFRLEMKEEHKRADGKMDLIYRKLTQDIEEIKNKPEPKFKIVRES